MVRGLLFVCLLLGWAVPARARRPRVPLCVQFHGPSLKRKQAYQRLLEDEVNHYRSHQAVRRDCRSTLAVEYIQLDTTGYLTGRIDRGVPRRVKVKVPKDIPKKFRELVSALLKSEPVYLVEHLETSGLLRPPAQSLLRHGRFFYGIEIQQTFLWANGATSFVPGAAFRLRRAVDRWFLGARVSFGMRASGVPDTVDRHLVRMFGTGKLEVGVNLLPTSAATVYLSGLIGVDWMQLYGPRGDTGTRDDFMAALATVSVRVGVELFRFFDFRLDLFAVASIPFHEASNVDSEVAKAYTPSVTVGCGVAF